MERTVFFISDSTGITTEGLGHSLLVQFDHVRFKPITIPYVTTVERAEHALSRINQAYQNDKTKPIVFSSIVKGELRKIISTSQGLVLDIFDLFIDPISKELQITPSHTVGKSHSVNDVKAYESRIEAIHDALEMDDGGHVKNYRDADIILIGVSRSGKTPTALYLAVQFGIRAANYPLTEEDLSSSELPPALKSYQEKLFGLIISPQRLHQIREERVPGSHYSSLPQCQLELKRMTALCKKYQIPLLDTTTYSIEEISTKIIELRGISRQSTAIS